MTMTDGTSTSAIRAMNGVELAIRRTLDKYIARTPRDRAVAEALETLADEIFKISQGARDSHGEELDKK